MHHPHSTPLLICFGTSIRISLALYTSRNAAGYMLYILYSVEILDLKSYDNDSFGMMMTGLGIASCIAMLFLVNRLLMSNVA